MKATTKVLLGSRIKELRKIRKLSQEQLAEMVNIDPKHLSRIEVGKSFPSLDTLKEIANALKLDLKDFFEFTDKPQNSKEITKSIHNLLKGVSDEKLHLILKIIYAIIR